MYNIIKRVISGYSGYCYTPIIGETVYYGAIASRTLRNDHVVKETIVCPVQFKRNIPIIVDYLNDQQCPY